MDSSIVTKVANDSVRDCCLACKLQLRKAFHAPLTHMGLLDWKVLGKTFIIVGAVRLKLITLNLRTQVLRLREEVWIARLVTQKMLSLVNAKILTNAN